MGLDDLVSCIELLQERIRAYGATLGEAETRTRMALIDPLLTALGWNIADPGTVTPEYKVGRDRADYALLRPDGKPLAILEAKKLGERFSAHQKQMVTYAAMGGIKYSGMTDGNRWELYEILRTGTLEERRILKVSIADDPRPASALKLLLLWRPNFTSGEPVNAEKPIILDCPRGPTDSWVRLPQYDPPPRTPCPSAIRFWDGSTQKLERWNQLLVSVVGKLYAENRISVEDLPISRTRKAETCIVNAEPFHPTGRKFIATKRIEGTLPLFVNVNFTAQEVRRTAQFLLKRYDQNPADVYLHVA